MLRQVRLFPLGHPVEIFSASEAALDAARSLWSRWPPLFDRPPLSFEVELDAVGTPQLPDYRLLGGVLLLSSSCGAAAFSTRAASGWMRLDREVLERREWVSHHWLQPLVQTALDMTFFEPLHAACIARDGRGVLLCGDAGAGKTTLAYACAKAGWTLVSEDGVRLVPGESQEAVGGFWTFRLREPARALFPELEALPLVETQGGKSAMLLDAAAAGFHTALQARVRTTVFLRRRAGPAGLHPLPVDHALAYFLQTAKNPDRAASEARLCSLLSQGCYALAYEHVDDAIRLLEKWA